MGEISSLFKDSLPLKWKIIQIREAFSIQQGKQLSKKNRIGENQRQFLRTKNVFWGKLDLSDLDSMHFTEAEEKRLALQYGDLLLCEGGDVGRTSIWRDELERCYYQNHLHRLRPNGKISSEFALYWFWYAFSVGPIYFGRKNITTIPNMSKSRLAELPIICPPLHEQRKIAAVLSLVQRAIEKQERLIQLTTELKKALMKKLFTGGLHGEPQKMTEIGPIPESWVKFHLKDIGEVTYGIQSAVAKNIKPTGTKILTNKNITLDGEIILDEINYFELKTNKHFESLLKKGDILFNWRSGSKKHIGKTAYFDLDGEYTHSSFLIRIRPYKSICGRYIFWYLFYLRDSGYFSQKHNISSVNKTFNKSAVESLPLYIPDNFNSQKEIVNILDKIKDLCSFYKQRRDLLQSLFRTFLHQLMTAKIRVNDIDLDFVNKEGMQ